MRGSLEGNFNSHYREILEVTVTGSENPAANGTHKTTREATWIGPCAPGQTIGDVIFSSGVKQNMLNGERGPVPN